MSSNDTDSEMDSGMEVSVVGEADSDNLKSVPVSSSVLAAVNRNIVDHCGSAVIGDVVKKNYMKTVLLTFAQDGYELANQVARQIRSLNLGIGVLILEENREELEFCGESIYRWYQEASLNLSQVYLSTLIENLPSRSITSYPSSQRTTCGRSRQGTAMKTLIVQNRLASTPATSASFTS